MAELDILTRAIPVDEEDFAADTSSGKNNFIL